jgi:hypothetical protein
MGHRALLAYERPDETYNLHYTHWGGCNLRLKYKITPKTPFGGDDLDNQYTQRAYDHLQHADGAELPSVEAENEDVDVDVPETDVEVEPRAVAISLDEAITEHLDYHMHEAFYVVSQEFDVTAYRTFWLGFSSDAESLTSSPSVGHGALLTVRWYDGRPVNDGYLRGWFDGMKQILGDRIDRELFTESQAVTFLLEQLLAQAHDEVDYYVRRADDR